MHYYKCEDCGTLFNGFAVSLKCDCGDKLKEISKEEYEEGKKHKKSRRYRELKKSSR